MVDNSYECLESHSNGEGRLSALVIENDKLKVIVVKNNYIDEIIAQAIPLENNMKPNEKNNFYVIEMAVCF